MVPYCQPQPKDTLIEAVSAIIDGADDLKSLGHRLQTIKDAARNSIGGIGVDAIQTKRALCSHVSTPVKIARAELLTDESVNDEEVNVLLERVGLAVSLLFYGEYIEKIFQEKVLPYCTTHTAPKAPKKWGLGSVFYFDDQWGRSFYSFWKNNIEKDGDDEFYQRIVSKLPRAWKLSYEMKNPAIECPFKWDTMTDQKIAETLLNLKKKNDPKKNAWGIGSIGAGWTGPQGSREAWGKSFWNYWRQKVEKKGDDAFKERILPFFPEDIAKNYSVRKTRAWTELSPQQIADLLSNAARKTDDKEWCLWSTKHWILPGDDAPSQGFPLHWRDAVSFEAEILPLMSDALRVTYRGPERDSSRPKKKTYSAGPAPQLEIDANQDPTGIIFAPNTPVFEHDGEEVLILNSGQTFTTLARRIQSLEGKPIQAIMFYLGRRKGKFAPITDAVVVNPTTKKLGQRTQIAI